MKRCGTLLLNKPSGITSQGAVAVLRRASGERRVGHAGTLDPLATGLLLLCFGPATRICEYLVGHDKRYLVSVRLGVETTTYDREGEVSATHDGPLPSDAAIEDAAQSLRGEQMQSPPAYSAVKVGGRPLYWHARRGEAVAAAPRRVVVHALAWQRPAPETLALDVLCTSGTYVRSLVHDLGVRLGCGAHVAALQRLSVGPFRLEDACGLDEAVALYDHGDGPRLLTIAETLPHVPRLAADPGMARRLSSGQRVAGPPPVVATDHLAVDEAGRAFAVVRYLAEAGLWQARKVFDQEEGLCRPA